MTQNLAQSLRLPKVRTSISVTGIGETHTSVRQAALITITPSASDTPAYSTSALVLKSLTRYLPNRSSFRIQWPHLKDLNLVDQNFAESDPIDVLIGADSFGALILDGVRKGAANKPIAQNTVLGWIISGPTGGERPGQRIDVEEISHTTQLTPEDQACEDHFLRTHYQNPDGRYVVRLPFKNGPSISIGESRNSALQNYLRAENRLKQEPTKAAEYHAFLKEYADLEHMQRVPDNEKPSDPTQIVFIPHHAVFWKSSATIRQRPKWRVAHESAKVGQMVLMQNALAPPCRWELGRITACHPGVDGLTQVVTVKTARSQYKRPIVKLCFLPIDINFSQSSAMADGVNTEPCNEGEVDDDQM
ncbi:uncharacterized protein LOC112461756 [Temnothorax curvispinosus]|uniref:Uncharacterized protein LOC112461756 n=1 Tax=Temnothorax curvispinosus TaxID=300111 RepID=A0A6J1QLW5_9HYME|nr:uncharacterized protein LOC112461756 [Temnothorax curvispinosus]